MSEKIPQNNKVREGLRRRKILSEDEAVFCGTREILPYVILGKICNVQ